MRVLVNALPLRQGGGVTYFQQQMAALAHVAPELDLHTLVSPWGRLSDLPGTTEVVPVRSVPTRFGYEQFRIPLRRADVLYCPANFGPVVSQCPVVMTIHDAHYYGAGLHLDEAGSPGQRLRTAANHMAMRRANVIIAVSRSLADDAAKTVPKAALKIVSVPCGSPTWPEQSSPMPGLPAKYILAVAGVAAHKRLDDLVTGWRRSINQDTGPEASLVIVGSLMEAQIREYRSIAGRHAGEIYHLGEVRDRSKLKWLYERAICMVSMSRLESLSLTPLEAGSVGCPLILSDLPVHREITMGNATFVQPGDCDELARVLKCEAYYRRPGSAPWAWPHTWEENATTLAAILQETSRTARSRKHRKRLSESTR